MRYIIPLLFAIILSISNVYAQTPLSHQGWQTATISGGAITVSCAALIVPFDKGSLLVETSPTTVRGEMDSALRSAHPIRVLVQPESGTDDILTTISGCTIDGAEIQIAISNSSHNITVQHNLGAIQFVDGLDFQLDDIAKVLTLVRKSGIWVPAGGGSGSSGGNIIMSGDQRIDFGGMTIDGPNKGLIVPMATNCAFATTLGQFCYDFDDRIVYMGTGTGIVAITGEGISGCFGLDACFDLGQTIDGLNGRANALKLLDSNNDGVLIYVDATGIVFECINDYGGAETPCLPTELRDFQVGPEAFTPDATHFVHNASVTLNAQMVNFTLTAADNNAATITTSITMPDRWDGTNFVITSFLHTLEPTPGGNIHLDWTGFCVIHGGPNAHSTYPTPTANGVMLIGLTGHAMHDLVITPTAGNVPLSGCTGDVPKVLWLKGQVSATPTTASDLNLQHFFKFIVKYGSKDFSD